MKKTLIALAVAASAAVSGSAMAWTASGTGGSVDFGGTLSPVEKVTPWEVEVGAAVSGLDAHVHKGDTKVDIPVENAIPVLGIRTQAAKVFRGQAGIAPQIDFKGAINPEKFANSETPLTLDVKDAQEQKIGQLEVPLFAGAEYSFSTIGKKGKNYLSGDKPGYAFYGGLGRNGGTISRDVHSRVKALNSQYLEHYDEQGAGYDALSPHTNKFEDTTYVFSSYYGSGIEKGKTIKLTLEQGAASDAIAWKASLPITVSYQ